MKKVLRPAAVAALISLVVFSCKKKEEDTPPPTTTDLLTTNIWMMSDVKLNPLFISIWDSIPVCERDNLIKFETNGLGTDDNGATKCDPADAQTRTFKWSWLNAAQDQLRIVEGNDTLTFKSVVITATTMHGNTQFDAIPVTVYFDKH